MELIKFIFSNFWVFCGTIVLIWSVGLMLTCIAGAISKSKVNVCSSSSDTKPDRPKEPPHET
jgi:hypothetical protein